MDSEESRIEKLVNQCKSNDVDVKVDALAKLQIEFENGAEIPDVDAVLSLFKAALRTSNQHLTNATLHALPPLLPLIITRSVNPSQSNGPLASSTSGAIDVPTLRQAFGAFLTSGGIPKAREALVLLGGYAFRAGATSAFSSKSGKGAETPIMAKVWKVREQSIIALVNLRRTHPQFPIRPFLSLLVDCLEDTDAHVRDCARTSVVDLFSGPHVTDAARADLKKEMTKKNVRKTIVDGVLSKLLSGQASNSTPHTKEYLPPSMMLAGKRPRSRSTTQANVRETFSRPESRGAAASPPPPPPQPQTPSTSDSPDVQPAYIASTRDLESEFAAMAKPFEGKESEHNWAARDAAVQRVRGMIKGDVHSRYAETFHACLKEGFIQWSLKTLASLRTTVAMNTCSLYSEMTKALGTGLDPYCDLLLTNLLKMAAFTKKITAQQSQVCVVDIMTHTSAPSRVVLPLLWTTLQEKTVQARAFVVGHFKAYLELHGARSRNAIEGSGGLEILEKSIKKALADPNPAVKESSRAMFWTFDTIWHDSATTILESLDATARKQLEKACPNPELIGGVATATPKVPKKSSIAAAIAASRAKAKAIANAPPSLRHQATAAAQTQTPRTSPKPTFPRPSSPLRTSSSPGSPPSRTPASQTLRSVSSGAVPVTNKRARSPSLSDPHYATRRRTSSPLATSPQNNMNTLRKAMQTALPASPPSSTGQQSPHRRPPSTLRAPPAAGNTRQSLMLPMASVEDESLLMAQTVPIPEGDTDSEDDHSMNLMSFSAAYDKFPQLSPRSVASKPTASVSNALSSGSMSDVGMNSGGLGQPEVVEDALRARAEQAESAAERLLELVDENDLQEPIIPVSLGGQSLGTSHVNGNGGVGLGLSMAGNGTVRAKAKTKPAPVPLSMRPPPVTPKPSAANARASAIMKQAAMFRDSPVAKKTSSLLDVLQAQRHETGWWLKRTALFAKASTLGPSKGPECLEELKALILALENGQITKEGLQKVAVICSENPGENSPPASPGGGPESLSPFVVDASAGTSSLGTRSALWDTDRVFGKVFSALMAFVEPTREDELEYALIIVWEMLENQGAYLEGREADLFSMLLRVRYCNKVNAFQAEPNAADEAEVKACDGCLWFTLRLPAEIAEEELPRLKGTLIAALNDRSSLVVRESAAAAIISAQLVLKDETQLFALLDGLADDKKNLLTYLFDKHGARGTEEGGDRLGGIAKFQKEIRRLDTRTSTPLRVATRE
ncbi:clasp N terminal-domain-containing protein [Ephemerocybe angulata]|uniref:Clasp N terminal-domain-containing protein n=1 Tax=Ephemerocybe angulata TaxID=980116 RepID=A0A8H6MFW0_9AGAR|nr:clasp N terminal-domain-containing protein [Tulosesus angulatus]